ncbi:uncharacterized protein LOC134092302 [Sardina pilchardus]|uniref:uncharacterized protein LOC134092302 n=1 Tax=Sardina pilchardus TaxID=27697 RepID=UPI002E1222B3
MPLYCCAPGCSNNQHTREDISFYRIPRDADRRRRWIAAINRKDWEPSTYQRLCSDHFVGGKKSNNPLSPDYVPSVFKYLTSPQKRRVGASLEKFHQRQDLKRKKREAEVRINVAHTLLGLSDCNEQVNLDVGHDVDADASVDADHISVCCQTDLTMTDMTALEIECQNLRADNADLKLKLVSCDMLSEESFRNNDEKVRCLTGLPSFTLLFSILSMVRLQLKDTPSMSCFQQVLLTCMRLRMNLTMQFLGYLFNVSSSTVSRVFENVLSIFDENVVPACVIWPERGDVRTSLPMCFRKHFPDCICIIDCFEIFMETPTDLKAKCQTYSKYKAHNTMKYLIGITPQGVISFISRGWGGRATDNFITANSGFLDNLLPGDLVLADRGFTIQDQVGLYCARVEIPAFTRGKKQLSPVELEDTRKLASVRIHVERVIGLARLKYTMLQGPVPISLLYNTENSELTTLDKIVRVACALTNICPSVIPFD